MAPSDVDSNLERASTLILQLKTGLDFYGHPKNYAQTLSVGTWEASNSSIIAGGIALDTAISNYQAQRDDPGGTHGRPGHIGQASDVPDNSENPNGPSGIFWLNKPL